ncbi:hypothetical protein LDENG_00139480 [Lucifuga dentata]|nr:hypothetical protein LDENG_00139480 [Lucifuga dentata]
MAALCDAFLNGLADYIKDELVSHDLPTTLDGLIELATRIDLRIQAQRCEKLQRPTRCQSPQRPRRTSTATSSTTPDSLGGLEPMQLGCTSLMPEEREQLRQLNLCLYCGQAKPAISFPAVKKKAGLISSRGSTDEPHPDHAFPWTKTVMPRQTPSS